MPFVPNNEETNSTKIGVSRKKFSPLRKICRSLKRNPQLLSLNLHLQKSTLSKNQRKIEQLSFAQLVNLPQMIDRKFLLPAEVGKEKAASPVNNLDLLALTSLTSEMIEVKTFRKIHHNLRLPRVRDPTIAEREKNAQRKIVVHTKLRQRRR